jgi:hypothetical protein
MCFRTVGSPVRTPGISRRGDFPVRDAGTLITDGSEITNLDHPEINTSRVEIDVDTLELRSGGTINGGAEIFFQAPPNASINASVVVRAGRIVISGDGAWKSTQADVPYIEADAQGRDPQRKAIEPVTIVIDFTRLKVFCTCKRHLEKPVRELEPRNAS